MSESSYAVYGWNPVKSEGDEVEIAPLKQEDRSPSPTGSSFTDTTESDPGPMRRGDPGWIPRPRNAFMIFRCEFAKAHARGGSRVRRPAGSKSTEKNLSKRAGEAWNSLSRDQRKPYIERAEAERQEHARQHPDYRFRPTRRPLDRRSNRRTKSDQSDIQLIRRARHPELDFVPPPHQLYSAPPSANPYPAANGYPPHSEALDVKPPSTYRRRSLSVPSHPQYVVPSQAIEQPSADLNNARPNAIPWLPIALHPGLSRTTSIQSIDSVMTQSSQGMESYSGTSYDSPYSSSVGSPQTGTTTFNIEDPNPLSAVSSYINWDGGSSRSPSVQSFNGGSGIYAPGPALPPSPPSYYEEQPPAFVTGYATTIPTNEGEWYHWTPYDSVEPQLAEPVGNRNLPMPHSVPGVLNSPPPGIDPMYHYNYGLQLQNQAQSPFLYEYPNDPNVS